MPAQREAYETTLPAALLPAVAHQIETRRAGPICFISVLLGDVFYEDYILNLMVVLSEGGLSGWARLGCGGAFRA